MSSAACMQAEEEHVTQVVGVHATSLREARLGLVFSLGLVALLVAVHPNWKALGVFGGFEVGGAAWATVRTIREFRMHLDLAEPLPTHAVEASGRLRPKERWTWKRAGWMVLSLILGIGGLVAFLVLEQQWFARFAALVIALASTQMLLRPLAEAFIVSRWERAHGGGRLFRPALFAEDDDAPELFVAHRPVPAA
jgi:hypothetical protein